MPPRATPAPKPKPGPDPAPTRQRKSGGYRVFIEPRSADEDAQFPIGPDHSDTRSAETWLKEYSLTDEADPADTYGIWQRKASGLKPIAKTVVTL